MNREDVLRVVRAARESGERPNLSGVDLYGVDLRGVNLRDVHLQRADLRCVDLQGADLSGADLWGANLWGADLRDANLQAAYLWGATLCAADLQGADLWGADLWGANLRGATWGGLQITDLPSGQLTLTPTPDGWEIRVGCWDGTPDQLRNLIAQDHGWPEAEGDEINRRRPYLQAALALCEVHMKDHQDVIEGLKKRWGNE